MYWLSNMKMADSELQETPMESECCVVFDSQLEQFGEKATFMFLC